MAWIFRAQTTTNLAMLGLLNVLGTNLADGGTVAKSLGRLDTRGKLLALSLAQRLAGAFGVALAIEDERLQRALLELNSERDMFGQVHIEPSSFEIDSNQPGESIAFD